MLMTGFHKNQYQQRILQHWNLILYFRISLYTIFVKIFSLTKWCCFCREHHRPLPVARKQISRKIDPLETVINDYNRLDTDNSVSPEKSFWKSQRSFLIESPMILKLRALVLSTFKLQQLPLLFSIWIRLLQWFL